MAKIHDIRMLAKQPAKSVHHQETGWGFLIPHQDFTDIRLVMQY